MSFEMGNSVRFSMRDLVFTVIIICTLLSWYVNRAILVSELEEAKSWRGRACVLVELLSGEGWAISYEPDTGEVKARKTHEDGRFSTRWYNPKTCDGTLQ